MGGVRVVSQFEFDEMFSPTTERLDEPECQVLTAEHEVLLAKQAVDLDVFRETGGRSIRRPGEMPEGMEWAARGRETGILYVHHTVDSRVVPQYRPDDRHLAKGDPKYLQQSGTGSVISLHPRMRERIGHVDTVVVCEGTKQYLAAVSAAGDDVLVIGIQGCQNYSYDGVPLPQITDVAVGARQVAVIFDGDLTSNPNVYDAASRLRDNFIAHGVDDVRFTHLPVSGKNGLDDYLGASAPGRRTGIFERLTSHSSMCKPLPGRRPAKKQTDRRSAVPGQGVSQDWLNAINERRASRPRIEV